MMKRLQILGLMIGAVLWSSVLVAQTALNQVRLADPITAADTATVSLTAADNVSAGDVIYIDSEALIANSCNSTTDICTVRRGQLGTRAEPHVDDSIVWTGTAVRFHYYDPPPGGRCTRANAYPSGYEPWINILTGNISVCQQTFGTGATVAGYWASMNLGMFADGRVPYRPIFYPTSRTADALVITPALTVNLWDYLIASLTYSGPFEIFLPAPTGLLGKKIVISDFAGLASHNATSTAGRTITIRGLMDTETSRALAHWQHLEVNPGVTTSQLSGVRATTSLYVGITASSVYYWFTSPW